LGTQGGKIYSPSSRRLFKNQHISEPQNGQFPIT
jgi:hypothetical protein